MPAPRAQELVLELTYDPQPPQPGGVPPAQGSGAAGGPRPAPAHALLTPPPPPARSPATSKGDAVLNMAAPTWPPPRPMSPAWRVLAAGALRAAHEAGCMQQLRQLHGTAEALAAAAAAAAAPGQGEARRVGGGPRGSSECPLAPKTLDDVMGHVSTVGGGVCMYV